MDLQDCPNSIQDEFSDQSDMELNAASSCILNTSRKNQLTSNTCYCYVKIKRSPILESLIKSKMTQFRHFSFQPVHSKENYCDETSCLDARPRVLTIYSYCCNVCQECFKQKNDLIDHKDKHVKTKQTDCLKSIKSSERIEEQRKKRMKEKQLEYTLQKKLLAAQREKRMKKAQFNRLRKLNSIETYERQGDRTVELQNEGQFLCNVCGETFDFITSLKYHFKVVHKINRAFHCTECLTVCPSEKSLIFHMTRKHTGIMYRCILCCSEFKKFSNRKHHMELHRNIKREYEERLKSVKGSKRYNLSCRFRIDLKTREIERPFKCSTCVVRFAQSEKLKRHLCLFR